MTHAARTLIIAEAGVNHNGDIKLARDLIACAGASGADLVKFQSFITGKSISANAPKAIYQEKTTGAGESQYEMVRKLELSEADHWELQSECRRHNIDFFSTAFDLDSLDMLMKMGMDRIKVASGEITNLPLLRRMAQYRKPVILSTGMATLGEIEAALAVFEGGGVSRSNITVLHCNTEYPTPSGDVNLRAMQNIRNAFGVAVGYSDHTKGIEIAIAAVAMGATIIEKHFTLDRSLPGPDHLASLEPGELKDMVDSIRNVERAMGDGIKRPSPSEEKNKAIARKSLVARRAIRTGEAFSEENVTAKRPGTGLSPMRWDEIMGLRAARAFAEDELIEI